MQQNQDNAAKSRSYNLIKLQNKAFMTGEVALDE